MIFTQMAASGAVKWKGRRKDKLQGMKMHNAGGCSCAPEPQNEPAKGTVASDDTDHDSDPLAGVTNIVAVVVKNGSAADEALVGKIGLVHAVALLTRVPSRCASKGASAELVDHHALEDVGLVVDVVENIAPEGVEGLRWDEETTSAHPQAVGERGGGQCDDEDGDNGADQDDERLSGEQVEEKPHHPGEESSRSGAEVRQPVCDNREEDGDQEEVRNTSDEVGDDERGGAIKTVSTFLHEQGTILEESGNVSDSHE